MAKLAASIIGKNGKEYKLQQFNVQTNWHSKPFNIMAYGYPHARNVVNKMLGRNHLAEDGMTITRVWVQVSETKLQPTLVTA